MTVDVVKKHWLLLVALCGLLVLWLPFFILGEAAYLTIHDNLDSELVYFRLLSFTKSTLDMGQRTLIPQIMNGLPRVMIRPGLNVTALLYSFLPTFLAYVVNYMLTHIAGLVGMYLFLTRYCSIKKGFSVLVAIVFALVPFYSNYGLSVSGVPLLLWAFFNIGQKRNVLASWFILALFPFYSVLVAIAPFIMILLAVIVIYQWKITRIINKHQIIAIGVLGALYIAIDLPMIMSVFGNSNVSHRAEFQKPMSLVIALRDIWALIIKTQYHTGTFNTFAIIIAAILAVFFEKKSKLILPVSAGILLVIVLSSMANYAGATIGSRMFLLRAMQWDRFYFLLPSLWMILFAISLQVLLRRPRLKWAVPILIIVQALSILRYSPEIYQNWRMVIKPFNRSFPVYSEFYAPRLFNEIREYINRPQADYRIVNIGVFPNIAQYNGFYTLDSYQNNYPLEYKHLFRKVIAKELEKAPVWKEYFDNWGSRCYFYVNDISWSYMTSKNSRDTVKTIDADWEILRELGCEYVFSAVPVVTEGGILPLEFLQKFSDPGSWWNIYLYRLSPESFSEPLSKSEEHTILQGS